MISVIISPSAVGPFEAVKDLEDQTYRDFEVLLSDAPIPISSKALWLNSALQRARGDFILAMDSDDRLVPGALALLAAAADEAGGRAAAVIAGADVMGPTPAGQPVSTYTPPLITDKLDLILGAPPGPLFARSEAVRAIGGWPVDYPSEGNLYPNLALLMRLLTNHNCATLPSPVFRLRREKITTAAETLAWWPIYKFLVSRAAGTMGRRSEIRFQNGYQLAARAASMRPHIGPAPEAPGGRSWPASKPLVTVAISVYNVEAYVDIAIESALNQIYQNMVIIVIEDGSSDRTGAVVRSCLQRWNEARQSPPHGSRIRLIERSRNFGKASCLNLALEQACGEYLMELDGDDWLDPDAIEVFVEAMLEAGPETACVHGSRRAFSSTGPGDLRFQTLYPGRPIKDKYDFCRRPEALGPRFYRTACLRDVGGWPTDYPSGGALFEDLAILFRLADRYRFRFVDQPLYNVRLRPDSLTAVHQHQCWPILKELVRQALSRWGNKYVPEFDDGTYRISLRKTRGASGSHRSK